MPDLLDQILASQGKTREEYEAEQARFAQFSMNGRGVQDSAELRRILSLPRRQWESTVQEMIEPLSDYFRQPAWRVGQKLAVPQGRYTIEALVQPDVWRCRGENGVEFALHEATVAQHQVVAGVKKKPMLRPVQVQSIIDMHDYGGLFGPQRVGSGKSLSCLLAPVVLEAKRPLLLNPAKLVEKVRREMHEYRKHWLIPNYVRLMSYELLGRPQSAHVLDEYQPDLLILDETHRVKNPSAAVTKRIKHWLDEHPDTKVIALSGTITKRSLHDFAHIAHWALKRTNPTPRDFPTRQEWSCVLDEKTRQAQGFAGQIGPGALIQLCNDEERGMLAEDSARAVRRAFRRRLVETPGVVATQEGPMAECSLSIESELVRMPEPGARQAVATLRNWERPDGEPIMDGIELWRHLREAACGMWYRWNPAPPLEWMNARRAWSKVVREILKHNRQRLDSESMVMRAVSLCESREHPQFRQYTQHKSVLDEWLRIRPTYTPKTEAVWFSDAMLKYCITWANDRLKDKECNKPIIWVEHVEFGQRLMQMSGLSFYQRGGVNQHGKAIEDEPPGRPMILSIASNAEGRNLQAWNANLIVSCPSSGATLEQLLGRTHRDGQESDEVSVTLPVTLKEQVEAFERARRDAQYITDTTGQEQKLSYADITVIPSEQAPILPDGTR